MNFGIKQDQEGLYVIVRVVYMYRGPVTFWGNRPGFLDKKPRVHFNIPFLFRVGMDSS